MRWLILDTETTGLPLHPAANIEKQPQVVEFGAVVVDDGQPVEWHDYLFNPGKPLPPEITKITGLTDADLADEEPFNHNLIAEILRSVDGAIAHNMAFDKLLIDLEFQRAGIAAPWPKRIMCSMWDTAPFFKKNQRMQNLYAARVGRKLDQTHRALDDCLALHEILAASNFYSKCK